MILADGGHESFAPKLTCLGSNADFSLDDAEDAKNRINKASKAMGALKFTWGEKYSPLEKKIRLHRCMLLNLLL